MIQTSSCLTEVPKLTFNNYLKIHNQNFIKVTEKELRDRLAKEVDISKLEMMIWWDSSQWRLFITKIWVVRHNRNLIKIKIILLLSKILLLKVLLIIQIEVRYHLPKLLKELHKYLEYLVSKYNQLFSSPQLKLIHKDLYRNFEKRIADQLQKDQEDLRKTILQIQCKIKNSNKNLKTFINLKLLKKWICWEKFWKLSN